MKRVFLLALALTVAAPLPALPQKGKNDKAAGEEKGPYKDFAELTKDATVREGFFDTYQKGDHLYLAVPQERLGGDFLMVFEIAQGIGAASLFGGTMLSIFEGNVVAWERHGEKVYLLKRPHRYVAPEGTPGAEAVKLTFGSSVLASGKIESIREDSALVIDLYPIVVSDLSNISRRVRFAVSTEPGRPGNASFDKDRSYLESVKAFPKNVNVRAKLTFKPNRPAPLRSVPDRRYIPVSIHYTIAQLPEEPMTTRLGDDRMGYYLTTHKDFSRKDTTFFVRYVNRWRLEPGERVGSLYRPKKPIVYHVDRTIPEMYRSYVADGIEAWNKAFEKAGWKDAIRAEPLPEDADAEDLRYATIRWNASDQRRYGAIGPSIVDPRTGEIVDADILVEAEFILGFSSTWRNFVSPTDIVESMLQVDEGELESVEAGGELASLGVQIAAQGALLRTVLAARGVIGPDDPLPREFVGEAVKWVIMHEVGHSLGLRHNFRSSHDTPLEKLHDREWAETRGLVSSVMDYHAPNVAPAGHTNGYYYTPVVGSYDEWVIAYGYTSDPDHARRLAREGGLEGHTYGTDLDAFGPGALDPTVNIYDLGEDPLEWGKERAAIVADLLPKLPERVLTDNSRYADLTIAFNLLLSQYATALLPAVKYIGGQYTYRTHVGDVNDHGPFRNVPKAKQQDALRFLTQRAFAENAFELPREVLAKFGGNRWAHWGSSQTFNGRLDYPFYEQSLGIQMFFLNQLTHPFRLARIRDAEYKFGSESVLTIPELFDEVTSAIWSEVWRAPGRNISASRRDLQRAYIDRMTEILTNPPARLPADARSVARVQLRDLNQRVTRRLTPPYNFNAYTFAHLSEVNERIEKALEAGLEVERSN